MLIDYQFLAEEYAKCYIDKSRVYMIQNYLKTYDATQKKEVPFKLFPRQQDICTTLGNSSNVVMTKPRQAGISTTASAFISCEMALADKDTPITALVIGNTLDLAQLMLFKIRDFLLQFPLWMWGDEFMNSEYDITKPPTNKNVIFDTCNGKEVKLKNGSKIVARSSGPDASRGVGGVTWLCFDEASFIENGKDVFASALPTVSTGGHIIMISTPNGKDQLYYETCRRAKLKGSSEWNSFELIELKWFQDPRYNKFLEWYRKNSETNEIEIEKENYLDNEGNVEYTPEKWDKREKDGWKPRSPWYIKMCQQFNNDEQKIAQELDVSFLGSASNVVAPEYIEMQERLNVKEPNPNYKDPLSEDTWVWKMPIEGHRYICACLPEGEKVQTIDGYKLIENVKPSDKLINLSGDIENIKECKRRFVENETVFSLRISNNHRYMKFTGEHPIWASNSILKRWYSKTDNSLYNFNEHYYEHNFTFYKTKDLKEGMWVSLPNRYLDKEISIHELNKIGIEYGIKDIINLTDFWYYCGIWLAEGCTWTSGRGKSINTTHNKNETCIINRISNIICNIFNRKPQIITIKNTTQIKFTNKILFNFFNKTFGKYAHNKNIPEWVKILPFNLKKEFILGYFHGDGSIYTNKRDGKLISFGSTSLSLLENLQDMLFALGMLPCLSLSSKKCDRILHNKIIHCKNLYEIKLQKIDTMIFENIFCNENHIIPHKRISNCHFSKDKKTIYFQIKKINTEIYNGYVYNFETESHTFCANRCITHNCDPSRGDSADRTAIEILDLDGIDDNGKPCIEQVLEYQGKKTGDEIGEMLYHYGKMYGDAFMIVECIGGVGDAAILSLMRLGYTNLYYDDPTLKTYTIQREASSLGVTSDGKLPGFHSSSVRFQMLTHFAHMVKTNAFKIRSKRVITELDTWIYKGDAGRIDHMDGCHDDTLTCLAMALFVMQFSLERLQKAKAADAAILNAWTTSNSIIPSNYNRNSISMQPSNVMPFYSNNNSYKNPYQTAIGDCMWLFAGKY